MAQLHVGILAGFLLDYGKVYTHVYTLNMRTDIR